MRWPRLRFTRSASAPTHQLIKLAERGGKTLVHEDVAAELRSEIEQAIAAGTHLTLDFTGVAATSHFLAVLLTGLQEFMAAHPDAPEIAVAGMSDPIRRKVTLALQPPIEPVRHWSA